MRAVVSIAVFVSSCSLLFAGGNDSVQRRTIQELFQQQGEVRNFWQTALSPDGKRVAWAVEKPNSSGEEVYVTSLEASGKPALVSAAAVGQSCWEHDPVWSSDSQQMAFLSDCSAPGQAQIFVQDFRDPSPKPRQITHVNGFISRPGWLPHQDSVGFLFVDHAHRAPNPMAAENKPVGVIDDLQDTDVQQVALAELRTGNVTVVTPAGMYVFEFHWSPDGQQVAFTAAPPPGDDNWYIARLYTQSRASATARELYKPQFQIALPRWSPDSASIAFITGLMSDQGGTGGEIYVIPASGGTAENMTPGWKTTPSWLQWLSPSRMLYTAFDGGSVAIGELDVPSRKANVLWTGAESIRGRPAETSFSVAHQGSTLTSAVIRSSWSTLPEVWAGPIGQWKKITSFNASVRLPMPKFENVTWRNGEYSIQGWLLFPSDYDPRKRYPMLMMVHGGPAWIATPTWRSPDFNATLYTNFGYFVFFPNARGSYGQGEKFTQANRRDWGFGDLQDMLAGVDTVERKYSVDDKRVGILGWSYGGSTAMMAVTQTHRFRAAVAGAGAANWQSYYGENSIDKWMLPYFGASAYDDPAAYARCSAMTYIKNAKTPTLVMVGENDGEAPSAQSFEFWHALKELGVPTRLVIYPGEGHDFLNRSEQIDVTVRTLDWFEQYMNVQ